MENDSIMSRYEYNQAILNLLTYYVEQYPQLRFGQILVNLDIIQIEDIYNRRNELIGTRCKDPYNDESEDIYNRMRKE